MISFAGHSKRKDDTLGVITSKEDREGKNPALKGRKSIIHPKGMQIYHNIGERKEIQFGQEDCTKISKKESKSIKK